MWRIHVEFSPNLSIFLPKYPQRLYANFFLFVNKRSFTESSNSQLQQTLPKQTYTKHACEHSPDLTTQKN